MNNSELRWGVGSASIATQERKLQSSRTAAAIMSALETHLLYLPLLFVEPAHRHPAIYHGVGVAWNPSGPSFHRNRAWRGRIYVGGKAVGTLYSCMVTTRETDFWQGRLETASYPTSHIVSVSPSSEPIPSSTDCFGPNTHSTSTVAQSHTSGRSL